MDMSVAAYLLIFVLGLCFGSFFNVVIYRFPLQLMSSWRHDALSFLREQGNYVVETPPQHKAAGNICFPASHCPSCKHPLRFWMNIPVVSWLCLRAKCFFCQKKISTRYPLVELTTGIGAVFCAYLYGFSWVALYSFVIFSVLLIAALIDFDTQFLPDELTLGLLWFGLLINLKNTFVPIDVALIGAISGYLFFYAIFWLFKWFTGKEGLGYGDFKLLAALGACFGWESIVFITLSASFFAIVAYGVLFKSIRANRTIAFGPYLAFSGILVLLTHPTFSSLSQWLS